MCKKNRLSCECLVLIQSKFKTFLCYKETLSPTLRQCFLFLTNTNDQTPQSVKIPSLGTMCRIFCPRHIYTRRQTPTDTHTQTHTRTCNGKASSAPIMCSSPENRCLIYIYISISSVSGVWRLQALNEFSHPGRGIAGWGWMLSGLILGSRRGERTVAIIHLSASCTAWERGGPGCSWHPINVLAKRPQMWSRGVSPCRPSSASTLVRFFNISEYL